MRKKIVLLCGIGLLFCGVVTGCGREQSGNETAPTATAQSTPESVTTVPAPTVPEETDDAGDDAEEAKSGGPYTFGYTCMDGTNPFFVTIEDAIRTAVEAKGDKLISTDPANDVSLQITQIEDMIAQGMDGIFLNPAEAEGILPALDALKEAEVPIVNFDTEVADLSYVTTYTGSDNYNAGKVCGEDLVKKCPDGGPIIVLDSPTMNSVVDRTNGFLDAIEGKGFDIVAQQDAKGNLEVSMGIAEDLLQAHSDVVAILSLIHI